MYNFLISEVKYIEIVNMVLKQWLLVFGVSVTLNWVFTCYSQGVSGLINSINFHAFKELLIHLKHLHRYQFLWRIFVSHLVLNSVSGFFFHPRAAHVCVHTCVCEHRLLRLATPLVHEATTTAIIFIMEIKINSLYPPLSPALFLHTLISKVSCVSCHFPFLSLSLVFHCLSAIVQQTRQQPPASVCVMSVCQAVEKKLFDYVLAFCKAFLHRMGPCILQLHCPAQCKYVTFDANVHANK